MPYFSHSHVILAVLSACCLGTPSAVWAQDQTARSSFTNTEMTRIRNQAVGRGYSVDQLTSITKNQARAQIGIQGIGGGNGVTVSSLGDSNFTRRSAASFNSFGGSTTSKKPFSSSTSRPTVSPYLNLFRDDLTNDFDNYNTLVRPQLRQQDLNQTFRLQTQAIDRHVQSISAKPAFNPQGSVSQSPTGHPTGFMYYSHFYPSAGRVQGRR